MRSGNSLLGIRNSLFEAADFPVRRVGKPTGYSTKPLSRIEEIGKAGARRETFPAPGNQPALRRNAGRGARDIRAPRLPAS